MEEGISMLDEYLGNFFIRKCMWSTPANIKTNATSIKKFYKCMLEHGKIEKVLQAVVYAGCRTFLLISFTVPNSHLPATP